MGLDRKYGKVTTEFGSIGENEPVVVFRAQDITLPSVLLNAAKNALIHKSPPRHVEILLNTFTSIVIWQLNNSDKVKIPTSESSKNRLKN